MTAVLVLLDLVSTAQLTNRPMHVHHCSRFKPMNAQSDGQSWESDFPKGGKPEDPEKNSGSQIEINKVSHCVRSPGVDPGL